MIRRGLTYLRQTLRAVNRAAVLDVESHQALLRSEIDRLRAMPRYRDSKHLIPYGGKSYSQCDEDGILAEIFRRIGTTDKSFVEFGIGDGLENNTIALLFDGWHGLWIEASSKSVQKIRSGFSKLIDAKKL